MNLFRMISDFCFSKIPWFIFQFICIKTITKNFLSPLVCCIPKYFQWIITYINILFILKQHDPFDKWFHETFSFCFGFKIIFIVSINPYINQFISKCQWKKFVLYNYNLLFIVSHCFLSMVKKRKKKS